MFASLLPGLRDARVALAAGYLYLLAGYLYFHERIAQYVEHDSDASQVADAISASFGGIGLGAGATFGALILGSIAADLTRSLFLRPGTPRTISRRGLASLDSVAGELRHRVTEVADSKEAETELAAEAHATAATLIGELPLVRMRLLAEDRELFAEVDRIEGEAEFRVAVGLALQTVALCAAVSLGAPWLYVAIPGIVLVAFGFRRARDAGDMVADALLLKRVRAPVMDRLDAMAAPTP